MARFRSTWVGSITCNPGRSAARLAWVRHHWYTVGMGDSTRSGVRRAGQTLYVASQIGAVAHPTHAR
eukprot:4046678-Prymnesium_polylepis.1